MISELPNGVVYSLDTSCLINAWGKNYPFDMFEPLWTHLDALIDGGLVVASAEVLVELERQDDDLSAWAKDRDDLFLDLVPELQDVVTNIMQTYPKLVATGRNQADPFVIGVAQMHNEPLTVVTEETATRASHNKPKIPFICAEQDVRCITFLDMLRETGWKM